MGATRPRGPEGGPSGSTGITGPSGLGIKRAIITDGKLILTYSDDTVVNVGDVIGPTCIKGDMGVDGSTGATKPTGATGLSIASSIINSDGDLILTYTNNETKNIGKVIDPSGLIGLKGDQGELGATGATGVSIASSIIDLNGELKLTYSNGQVVNTSKVVGS